MGHIHITVLLSSVAAILLLEVMNCEAHSMVTSSSSSGSSCNGLECPPHTSCSAHTTNVNGNSTSDKKCTTNSGMVVRQETVSIGNGQICVKNLTMNSNGVNVNHNCRDMSDQEKKTSYNQIRYYNVQPPKTFGQNQEALEGFFEKQNKHMERLNENMSRERERKKEALEKANNYRQKMLELRNQLHEKTLMGRQLTWEKYLEDLEEQAEARNEQLEHQQEARMLQMENARYMLERRAEIREEQMERALQSYGAYGK